MGDDTTPEVAYARGVLPAEPVVTEPVVTDPAAVALDDAWERPLPAPAALRRDVWVGLALSLLALAGWELARSGGMLDAAHTAPAEQIAWTVAMALPLCVRRRHPVLVMLVLSALFVGMGVRDPVLSVQISVQGFMFVGLFTAAAWGRDRRLTRAALAGVLLVMFAWVAILIGSGGVIDQWVDDPERVRGLLPPFTAIALYNVIINVLYFVGAWVAGLAAWRSARQRDKLRLQTIELREQQRAEARRAVLDERLRIARELHDVAAHHVSVIGVQAAAARRVLGVDGQAAGRALSAVEQSSRAAVGEMRQLLGVLRADSSAETDTGPAGPARQQDVGPRSPQPGLDELEALADESGAQGLRVQVHRVGTARPVASTVALSLYRTAQEALANVRRHSTATTAQVSVRFSDPDTGPDWVELEILDDGRPRGGGTSGSGLGHLGMRERAALHGGQADIGRRPFGGYRVRVRYPVDAGAPPEPEPAEPSSSSPASAVDAEAAR